VPAVGHVQQPLVGAELTEDLAKLVGQAPHGREPADVPTVGLGGGFQIIVSDHANLPESWFQDRVRCDWRDGDVW
jgi:hypothetical protein